MLKWRNKGGSSDFFCVVCVGGGISVIALRQLFLFRLGNHSDCSETVVFLFRWGITVTVIALEIVFV